MRGKERADLRAEAHHLDPTVHVGQHGLTPTLVASLDDALRTRELVKVKLGRTTELPVREAASQLATATASDIVQVIGRTVTLYRENRDLHRKPDDPPAWKR